MDWTAEQHHKMELMTRYKTSAERSFYRAFNAMRALRKDKFREEISIENLRKVVERLYEEKYRNAQGESDEAPETDAKAEAVAEVKSKAQPKTRATQRKRPAQIRLFTPKRSEKTMAAQAGETEAESKVDARVNGRHEHGM